MKTFISHLSPLIVFCLLLVSCKVDFNPNAEWQNIPVVYSVIDPEEDTVWARVQRCYLSQDNMLQYATVADSNNYAEGEISVHLISWRDDRIAHRWQMDYTQRQTSSDTVPQPLYYCATGNILRSDTDCVFQIVVLDNTLGDTLAQGKTNLVGFRPKIRMGQDTVEQILLTPSSSRSNIFGYHTGCRGEIKWNTVPRGRRYQPIITFFYSKLGDTLSITIPGATINDEHVATLLNSYSISQNLFLSYIGRALADNLDTLYSVDTVAITIAVCNEDLNAYLAAQQSLNGSAQNYQSYTNIQGGAGIFGSRRSHITVKVPSDPSGERGYLVYELKKLHVGFFGDWGK